MPDPAPPGDFRRMGSSAANLARQMMASAQAQGLTPEVLHDDLIGMAAHLLTMPLDHASRNGTLVATIERFRSLVRKVVADEQLDPAVLAVLGPQG